MNKKELKELRFIIRRQLLAMQETITDDKPGETPDRGYKPGDVWKTKYGNYRAMSPEGNVAGFGKNVELAKHFAKTGEDKKRAKDVDTERGEQDDRDYYGDYRNKTRRREF